MSEENVDLGRAEFDAWKRGDYDAWIEAFDAECECWPLRAQLEGRPYQGHEGLREVTLRPDGGVGNVRLVLNDIRDTGDRLAAVVQFEGRGRVSGAELDLPIGVIATVREGKIFEVRMTSDPAEALKVMGLSG